MAGTPAFFYLRRKADERSGLNFSKKRPMYQPHCRFYGIFENGIDVTGFD
jgi:hypothetical protein